MARYAARAPSGKTMRTAVQASSSAGRKSVRIEPDFAPCSPGRSFGNRDIFGIDSTYPRVGRVCRVPRVSVYEYPSGMSYPGWWIPDYDIRRYIVPGTYPTLRYMYPWISQEIHTRPTTKVRATLDHFSTLGLEQNASKSEIKAAYKKLAKQYHPDVCRGDQCQTKFIQIINAYEDALNGLSGSTYATRNCDAENYSEDCREELEDWENWMGWEGAGSLDFSVEFSRSPYCI